MCKTQWHLRPHRRCSTKKTPPPHAEEAASGRRSTPSLLLCRCLLGCSLLCSTGCLLPCDQVLECLARGELGNLACRDRDLLPGARITPFARAPLLHAKAPKPHERHRLTFRQGIGDRLHRALERLFGNRLGDACLLGDCRYQLGLVHGTTPQIVEHVPNRATKIQQIPHRCNTLQAGSRASPTGKPLSGTESERITPVPSAEH
jgi:hypothetical protein